MRGVVLCTDGRKSFVAALGNDGDRINNGSLHFRVLITGEVKLLVRITN